MPIGYILFIAWMAMEIIVVVGSIVWCAENGQWKNIEKAKFSMLEDREPAPWPGRKANDPRKPKLVKPAKG